MPLYRGPRRLILVRKPSLALPVVSFASVIAATNSGSTFTTAVADIGNPAYIATRRVIVAVVGGGNATIVQAGSTINSVAVDSAVTVGTNGSLAGMWIMSAVVPSGTTSITITAQMSGSIFGASSFYIYNVDNTLLNSITPVTGFTTTASTTTGTATANSLSGGFILAGLAAAGGATTGVSITASTETYVTDAINNNSRNSCAHSNGVGTNTPSSVTWSWTSANIAGVGIAAFR